MCYPWTIDRGQDFLRKITQAMKRKASKPRHCPRIFDKPDWPKKRKTVLDYVNGGYYIEDSIIAAGLSPQWWYKWQALADKEIERCQQLAEENKDDDYQSLISREMRSPVEFVEGIRREQAKVILENAKLIRKSDPLEYNARVRPQQWGKKDRMLLGNDPDNPMPNAVVHVYLPDNGRLHKPEDDT